MIMMLPTPWSVTVDQGFFLITRVKCMFKCLNNTSLNTKRASSGGWRVPTYKSNLTKELIWASSLDDKRRLKNVCHVLYSYIKVTVWQSLNPPGLWWIMKFDAWAHFTKDRCRHLQPSCQFWCHMLCYDVYMSWKYLKGFFLHITAHTYYMYFMQLHIDRSETFIETLKWFSSMCMFDIQCVFMNKC